MARGSLPCVHWVHFAYARSFNNSEHSEVSTRERAERGAEQTVRKKNERKGSEPNTGNTGQNKPNLCVLRLSTWSFPVFVDGHSCLSFTSLPVHFRSSTSPIAGVSQMLELEA